MCSPVLRPAVGVVRMFVRRLPFISPPFTSADEAITNQPARVAQEQFGISPNSGFGPFFGGAVFSNHGLGAGGINNNSNNAATAGGGMFNMNAASMFGTSASSSFGSGSVGARSGASSMLESGNTTMNTGGGAVGGISADPVAERRRAKALAAVDRRLAELRSSVRPSGVGGGIATSPMLTMPSSSSSSFPGAADFANGSNSTTSAAAVAVAISNAASE